MADRKAEPNCTSAPDTSNPTPEKETEDKPQCQQTSGDSSQNATSQVRISVLKAIANHQKKRISELERTLEKKRATIQRLSATPPHHHPPLPMVPPAALPAMPTIPTSAPITPAPTSSPHMNASPASGAVTSSSQPASQTTPAFSQPQPSPSTSASNHVMPTPMLGFPPQPHVSPYPYMFPPPDPAFAAQYMGVMPPAVLHPLQASHAQISSQTNQHDKGNEGQEQKQSRYWTPDEHERFLAGMKACGPKNYLQISEYVGTRNAKQVRTHAQKYQKRLEREDAKRRSDMRHGRLSNEDPTNSIAADAAAAVKAAAAAAMRGKVPGTCSVVFKDSDSTGTPAGPSSSSSGKQCHSSHHNSHGASSGDGSIGANRIGEQHTETSGTDNHSAAVAAIAAEAKALGHGVLPLEAIEIPPMSFRNTQPKMVDKDTGRLEDDKSPKGSITGRTTEPMAPRNSSEPSNIIALKGCSVAAPSQSNKGCAETTETSHKEAEDASAIGNILQDCASKDEAAASLQGDHGGSCTGRAASTSEMLASSAAESKMKTDQGNASTSGCLDGAKDRGREPLQSRSTRCTEAGNKQNEADRKSAGSVVHTKLTKTTVGHEEVTNKKGSGTHDGMNAVKFEPESVDSCANLTAEKNVRGSSAGQNEETAGDGIVKQECDMAVEADKKSQRQHRHDSESDRAKNGVNSDGTKPKSEDVGERSHSADEGCNDGEVRQERAIGDGRGTTGDADDAEKAGAAESRKRMREADEKEANKRARTDDEAEGEAAAGGSRNDTTVRQMRSNRGNITAGAKQNIARGAAKRAR